MSIEIMNLRKTKPSKPYDVRIDRSSPLGNPFPMKSEADRDDVCDVYEEWFYFTTHTKTFNDARNDLRYAYYEHGKLRLFCWCAPLRCHGETIKAWLEANRI